MEEEVEAVGKAFVNHYYNLFDTNRASLFSLYQPTSLLTFEGQQIQGGEDITNKLIQLPFDHCQHIITTIDCQPSSFSVGVGVGVGGAGILVFVSGNLQLSGEEHHLRFSQMFHLSPTLERSFFVQNDIFRLNYG